MGINSQISRLQTNINWAIQALEEKGVSFESYERNSSSLYEKIYQMVGGYPNGTSWETDYRQGGVFIKCMHYANNLFVAGDENYGLYYSEDGKSWSQSNITSGNITYLTFEHLTWFAYDSSNNVILYSTDGKNWQSIYDVETYDIYKIIYRRNIYVAGTYNGVYYSSDGITWTKANIYNTCSQYLEYVGGLFVVGGNDGIYHSVDGINWEQGKNSEVSYITYEPESDLIVVGFYDGYIYTHQYDPDGNLMYNWSWDDIGQISSSRIDSIHYANGMWVASTSDGIYYSTDMNYWSQSNITYTRFDIIDNIDGLWIAYSQYDSNGIYYSTDGMYWQSSYISYGSFSKVIKDSGIWIAASVSNNGIYYSSDGIDWKRTNITSGSYYDILHNNGIWTAGSYGVYDWSLARFIYSVTWENSNS